MPQSTPSGRSPLPRWVRRDVWSMTEGRCFYCGLHTNPFGTFHVDHMIPLSRGGTDDIRNLAPSCCYCNGLKATMTVQEFGRWYHFDAERGSRVKRGGGLLWFQTEACEHWAEWREFIIELSADDEEGDE